MKSFKSLQNNLSLIPYSYGVLESNRFDRTRYRAPMLYLRASVAEIVPNLHTKGEGK